MEVVQIAPTPRDEENAAATVDQEALDLQETVVKAAISKVNPGIETVTIEGPKKAKNALPVPNASAKARLQMDLKQRTRRQIRLADIRLVKRK